MDVGVVIVAAGSGKRMGAKRNKLWLELEGKSILAHTVERFVTHPEIQEVILVVSEQDQAAVSQWLDTVPFKEQVKVTLGGAERQDSVRAGLEVLDHATHFVLVHDAARPFITSEQINAIISRVRQDNAIVLAVPVKDTIKVVNHAGIVESTPARESLWAIQTPQAFRVSLLREAHQKALQSGQIGTDDAMLVEWLGAPVSILQGSYENIKITTPDDLWFGQEILRKRREQER
ncbi:2-C-methyl-D-erythritol 4-phosphate cytidylyltransferase [Brevibacillus sp. SYSU BS000544]|uniref:2-C-methyl-D-erythritol 4-phosphate cytidylyltransferase n=1 Tax=Brevibacillus sp. SYSU BS000544 TaxID=3416443 RepID=UPI003CE4C21A